MKKIALTGGGTAGHVNPNLAVMPSLLEKGFEIIYIGSKTGIERELIEGFGIPYFAVSTGKLRRYFDVKNATDAVKAVAGVVEARKILKKEKVDIVFSKGGFVGVPVVLAAKALNIPVVAHESDYTPGLANKIALPFAKKVCVTFPETVELIGKKAVLTGNPVRAELLSGNKSEGFALCGFDDKRPVLLVMGGSLGSKKINECVRSALEKLTNSYHVVHICGKGNVSQALLGVHGYRQFEYVKDELPHLFAVADAVISRAGAGAVAELLALKKPNILIPLSKSVSRGDQILNAQSFERRGLSIVIHEESLDESMLLSKIEELFAKKREYTASLKNEPSTDAVAEIASVINETALYCNKKRK